jgi:phosphatidylglycerol:prolipoprotein diacylglycerol transferase
VHPSQIYDSLTNLAVYGVLEWCYRRKRFDGQVFAGWLLIYPIARSFTEMFRGDYAPSERFIGGMTPAQLLSVAIFASGAILYWRLPRKLGARPAADRLPGSDGDA